MAGRNAIVPLRNRAGSPQGYWDNAAPPMIRMVNQING
jgi:hypothetical protein